MVARMKFTTTTIEASKTYHWKFETLTMYRNKDRDFVFNSGDDSTGSTFTIKTAGYYRLSGQLTLTGSTDKVITLGIDSTSTDGSKANKLNCEYLVCSKEISYTIPPKICEFSEGDVISMYIDNPSSGTLTISYGVFDTFFQIESI